MKVIEGIKYYTITEVGQLIGRTRCTILRWYEYEELTGGKLLPPFLVIGGNNAKYWAETDLHMFKEFLDANPKGSMTVISNKYSNVNK